MNSSTDKRLDGIDLTKFILVFLIIAIHALRITNTLSYAFVNGICRIAVPYYFIVSGFFCFKKAYVNSLNVKALGIYLEKILKLYIIWTIIYLPVIIDGMVIDNPKGHGALYVFFRWFILQFTLSGSYTHLWYINATLIGVIIVAVFLKLGFSPRNTMILSLVIYFIGLLGQTYYGLISNTQIDSIFQIYCKVFQSTRNGFFIGFPLIAVGMYLSVNFPRVSSKKAFILFIISCLLLIVEVFTTCRYFEQLDFNVYILLPFSSVMLFLFTAKTNLSAKINYHALRDISVLCFFIHMYVRIGIDDILIVKILKYSVDSFNSILRYTLVTVISFAISIIIYKLSKRFRFLEQLFH